MSACCTVLPVKKAIGNIIEIGDFSSSTLLGHYLKSSASLLLLLPHPPPGNTNIMELSHYHNFDGKNDRKGG